MSVTSAARGESQALPRRIGAPQATAVNKPPELPIPDPIWHRLLEFLQSSRTGEIRLHIAEGHVVGAEIVDQIRAPREHRAT